MPYINIGEIQLYYEEYGIDNKKTMVYFHGGPGESCLTYTHQAKLFGEKFHIISFDQYGVLRSDAIPDNTPFGVYDHVNLIEKMRIALNVKSWTPIGHSYGGMLACLYAYMYPDSVDGVIYDCPMWSAKSTAKTIAETQLPYYEAHDFKNEIGVCKEILFNNISSKNAFEKATNLKLTNELRKYCHVIDNAEYEQYIRNNIPDINVPQNYWYKFLHFQKMLFANGDFYNNYMVYLSQIKKPSLLMVGEYDMTCGKEQQDWFCEHSENGLFFILKNSAHMSWMQVPKKYSSLIVEFMENI